ncbi:MAG: hypothetical protein U5M23_01330 [Marinagarivorans sp.]|nr:hypothetical protein [Marinagarivorans sp.]
MTQQGEVLIFQTPDGGDIEVIDGVVTMTGGLESAVYLSMFGDDGDWWGNIGVPQNQKISGRLGKLIDTLPPIPVNLLRLEDAAKSDINWLGAGVVVAASMPALNTVKITVSIGETKLEFTENWNSHK